MTELRWDLVASFAVSVLINLALPFVVATFLARRYKAPWRWWFLGIGVFLVFVYVWLPYMTLPLNAVLERVPKSLTATSRAPTPSCSIKMSISDAVSMSV